MPTRSSRAGESQRLTRLDNGAVVLTESVPGARSAAAGAWIRQGSAHEPADLAGASHLIEHMVFRGTTSRSRREIALSLESVGGSLNAYTSREHTGYEARVLPDHIPLATEVISDLVRSPRLDEDDLNREREIVTEEIAMVEDTPDDLVFELHGTRMWGDHPYGTPILGSRESVASIPRDGLAELHQRRYVGANLIVAAAGAVEHGAFSDLVSRWFGPMEAGERTEAAPEPTGVCAGTHRVERGLAQVHIVTGAPTPGHSHPDRYALALLSAALGGGMSSRLFQRIREELALAYAVHSYQAFHAQAGAAGVYLATRPSECAAALDAVAEICRQVVDDGLADEELERVREQVKGQLVLSLESTGARLHRLASAALYDERIMGLDEVLKLVDGVSHGDIARVAAQVLDPERSCTLTLGPT